MGALDLADDDTGDDTDLGAYPDTSADTSPLAGTPRGALQKYVDAAGDTSGVRSALDKVTDALKSNRKMDTIQALFSAAGALGAPTRTGSIGETAANLGKSLSETLGTQAAARRQGDVTAAKLALDEAKSEAASRRALGVQAMKAMGTQSPNQKMIGKVVLGAPDPHTGAQQSYQYIEDPKNPGRLSFQIGRIYLPGDAKPQGALPLAGAPSPAVLAPSAALPPTEGDIDPATGKIREPVAAAPAATAPVADATPPGTVPLRPTESATPLKGLVGTPRELEAQYHLKEKFGINLDGLDQDTPVHIDMENGKPTAVPAADPLAKYNGLTGQSLIEALTPADQAEIKAIHDGRLLAPVTGTRAKEGARLLALTTAAYPDFDAGIAKAKFATRQAFTPAGKVGQNFSSIDTVMNHIDKLADDAANLNNISIPAVNAVKNAVVGATGHASTTNYDQSSKAVANELMRVFRGSGSGSTHDITEWQKTLDPNKAPDQQAGVIQGALKLVSGRLEPLVSQWNQTMGENRSVLSFISPKARNVFLKLSPDTQLTDDDKAYLASQEMEKRQKGSAALAATTTALKAPAAAAIAPVAAQMKTALPQGVTAANAMAQARAAVLAGKDPKATADRLRSFGLDTGPFEAWVARRQ